MGEIGIIIAVIIGAILAMVLLNKLLGYLASRFTKAYMLVLIAIALVSNLLFAFNPGAYCGLQILFFYLFFIEVDAEHYSTIEGSSTYNESTNSYRHEVHEEKHYRPGWWNKLLMVAFCTAVACVVTYAITSPLLTMGLELILPVWVIVKNLKYTR